MNIKRKIYLSLFTMMLALIWTSNVQADLLFDNGAPDPTHTTWAMTSIYGVVDDFTLTTDSNITDIVYETWHVGTGLTYLSTDYYIYSSQPPVGSPFGGSPLISDNVIASLNPNGIDNTFNPSPGYTHTISGLSHYLSAGTYFLLLRADFTGGAGIAIGNGNGSSDTIGPGLYQYDSAIIYLRENDHMAFKINETQTPIPEPATMLLLGTGLVGVAGSARRRKKNQA